MHSPDSATRVWVERAMRAAALAMIAWLLITSLRDEPTGAHVSTESAELDNVLARVTLDATVTSLHVKLEQTPDLAELQWLSALNHAGVAVSWAGDVPAVAVTADAVVDPRGGIQIAIAAPAGASVTTADAAGVIDSMSTGALGATVTVPAVTGEVRASVNGWQAVGVQPQRPMLRPVLVLGSAGWETKFTMAALEERGWPVVARVGVAPATVVEQGRAVEIDTAHISAVVVLDSGAVADAGAIARFVRRGGGLVLAGTAAAADAFAKLAPGASGRRVPSRIALVADSVGPNTLGFYPVVALKRGAAALHRGPDGVTIAIRRVAAGRVLQVGSDETWRWRMEGGSDSEAAHRAWWSRLVSAVAYAPRSAQKSGREGEHVAAPLAQVIDALGPASAPPVLAGKMSPRWRLLALAAVFLLLLGEWTSRRLRGAR